MKDDALHQQRLARACESLEGLSCGDAFGEQFFLSDEAALSIVRHRMVPPPLWYFTDDTAMALSIVATLEEHGEIQQEHLVTSFVANYSTDRGYGEGMHDLLSKLRQVGCSRWREEAQALFWGEGSFGNGAAMRVAPVGAYFADDLPAIIEQAERSAVTTHRHWEAVAGAIAVALAAGIAWQSRCASPLPGRVEFLEQVWERTPPSGVRSGIENAIKIPERASAEIAAMLLGNGSDVSAQDTVPFALWAAACHLGNYEEALWATVAALGDRDTTCAIVGGIVVMRTGTAGIPQRWLECREPLPKYLKPASKASLGMTT